MHTMAIVHQIQQIKTRMHDAALHAHRNPHDITLLAVSKGQSIEAIQTAFTCGLHHFGESYWQEAAQKQIALSHLPIVWHFIGTLQHRKLKAIAQSMDWVHSVDSLKASQTLAQHRPEALPKLNLCLQINLDDEPQKAGISIHDALPLALQIQRLPHVHLRGLMALPKPQQTTADQLTSFLRLTTLLNAINQTIDTPLDTLSMGMSQDFEAAILAGSTVVRIGEALFGPRHLPQT